MSSNFLLHNYSWQISLDKRLLYISFVTYREMIQIYWTNAEKISWTFLSQLETKTTKVWQPRKSGLRSIPFCLKVVVWFQFYWKKIKIISWQNTSILTTMRSYFYNCTKANILIAQTLLIIVKGFNYHWLRDNLIE